MAEDLDDDAARLEHSLQLLEAQHQAYLDQLDEPWNQLRAIAGLPQGDLRGSVTAPVERADLNS